MAYLSISVNAEELWDHLDSVSQLDDVRDMVASFDNYNNQRILKIKVQNPKSYQQGAWLAIPPPQISWNLAKGTNGRNQH